MLKFSVGIAKSPPFWGQLFIRFTVMFINCARASFPFGLKGGVWDLIESVPVHCLSFYLQT